MRVREESTEEEKGEEEEAEAVSEVEAEVEVEEEEEDEDEDEDEDDLKQEENVLKEEEDQISQMKFAQTLVDCVVNHGLTLREAGLRDQILADIQRNLSL